MRVPKLCVFAWLRGGRGRLTFRVEIVSARTTRMIGQSRTFDIEFADPIRAAYAKFMIENFAFPEPGGYIVELYCESEFLDDQPIQIATREET